MILQLLYIACCLWMYWMLRKKKQKSILVPPDLPGRLPLLGHAHLFWGDNTHAWKVIEWAGKETLKLGGVAILAIGYRIGYAITDQEDCMTVANACLEKEYYYGFAKPWLGDGLLMGNVSVWRKHRRLINPAFTQHIINGFDSVFNNQSRRLVQKWMNRTSPFRHNRDLSLNNLETICHTTLGIKVDDNSRINEDYENAIDEMLNILTERFKKIWLHSDFIYRWSSLKKRQDKTVEILHNMSNMALQKQKLEKNKIRNGRSHKNLDNIRSFIDVMSEFADGNDLYTDNDVREDLDNIIFAGHDTVSSAMTLTLTILGSYSTVQDKAYKEVCEIFGDSDRDVDKEDLSKMIYLEAIIKETMRLYPLGPVIARYVNADLKLKNYTIKAGSACFLLFSGLHQHPAWGPDADKFRPERWLDGLLPSNSNAYYGAFSLGRRFCIGKFYAMMSMKTTLVHILRRYKISSDITKLVFKLDTLLKPVSGFEITLKSRI